MKTHIKSILKITIVLVLALAVWWLLAFFIPMKALLIITVLAAICFVATLAIYSYLIIKMLREEKR